jgi:hypothetical protein
MIACVDVKVSKTSTNNLDIFNIMRFGLAYDNKIAEPVAQKSINAK